MSINGRNRNIVGKTFVFTGTLAAFTRQQAHDYVMEHGGDWDDRIHHNVDYLVAGLRSGSKLDKAHQYGITVLTEAQFLELVAGNVPEHVTAHFNGGQIRTTEHDSVPGASTATITRGIPGRIQSDPLPPTGTRRIRLDDD